MIIGIAGGSCSGKSTLAQSLVSLFSDRKTVRVQQDAYYKDQSRYPEEERGKINYDSPAVIDINLLVCHLSQLIDGQPVEKPIYDFVTHTREKDCDIVYPAEIIIVEGTLVFTDEKLCNLMDFKIFLDIPADVRLARRILRDTEERGRTAESVMKQWFDSVKTMYEKHVAPSKRYADIVLAKDPAQDDLELLVLKIGECL